MAASCRFQDRAHCYIRYITPGVQSSTIRDFPQKNPAARPAPHPQAAVQRCLPIIVNRAARPSIRASRGRVGEAVLLVPLQVPEAFEADAVDRAVHEADVDRVVVAISVKPFDAWRVPHSEPVPQFWISRSQHVRQRTEHDYIPDLDVFQWPSRSFGFCVLYSGGVAPASCPSGKFRRANSPCISIALASRARAASTSVSKGPR